MMKCPQAAVSPSRGAGMTCLAGSMCLVPSRGYEQKSQEILNVEISHDQGTLYTSTITLAVPIRPDP